jgi:hypothetical protein
MADKCYVCGNEILDEGDNNYRAPFAVPFVDGGVVVCRDCDWKIERKGHKGYKIQPFAKVRRAFSDKQADAMFARELPGVRCVYDYSEEVCS